MLDVLKSSTRKIAAARAGAMRAPLQQLVTRVAEARHARDVARMKAHLAWTEQQRTQFGPAKTRIAR